MAVEIPEKKKSKGIAVWFFKKKSEEIIGASFEKTSAANSDEIIKWISVGLPEEVFWRIAIFNRWILLQ